MTTYGTYTPPGEKVFEISVTTYFMWYDDLNSAS